VTQIAETGIERPGCTEPFHRWRREDQQMTTIKRRPRRDIVPNGDVRAALDRRFSSSAEPQTRLFWD